MKYFKEEEFHSGGEPCFDKMNPYLLMCLDMLRCKIDRPMKLNSTYRDEEYNKLIGGAKNSQHLLGNASDVSTVGWSGIQKREFLKLALELDLSVGVYENFFHIDCRNTTPTIWVG